MRYNIDAIKRYVYSIFPQFGINKQREITRLIYEISQRENTSLKDVIHDITQWSHCFEGIKDYLMKRRFPNWTVSGEELKPYLPKLSLSPQDEVKINRFKISPKNIYVEKKAEKSLLASRLKKVFPYAKFKTISSFKEYIKKKRFSIKDYNKRQDNFFLVHEKYDFFKSCPCTKDAVSCGYHIFNLGFGCVYECTYCYLQEYTNSPGIILPVNIEDFLCAFKHIKQNIRIGTGEFTDSLALDYITEFSPLLVDFFKKHPKTIFEFKTKSDNVKNLISAGPSDNVVISWSLNPQPIIDTEEFYTVSLKRRLNAALQYVKANFSVGFHFDPIIYYQSWEKDYEDVVNQLFDTINNKAIRWISLGTLRFAPALKKIIENRFPQSRILDEELALGFDGKMRYSQPVRADIYKKMLIWIHKRSKRNPIYLCMENKVVWKECNAINRPLH